MGTLELESIHSFLFSQVVHQTYSDRILQADYGLQLRAVQTSVRILSDWKQKQHDMFLDFVVGKFSDTLGAIRSLRNSMERVKMRQVLFGGPISQPLMISVALGPFSHSDNRFAFQVIAEQYMLSTSLSSLLLQLLLAFRCGQL